MWVVAERLGRVFGSDVSGLLGLFALLVVAFGLTTQQFLSVANFDWIRFSCGTWTADPGDARADRFRRNQYGDHRHGEPQRPDTRLDFSAT